MSKHKGSASSSLDQVDIAMGMPVPSMDLSVEPPHPMNIVQVRQPDVPINIQSSQNHFNTNNQQTQGQYKRVQLQRKACALLLVGGLTVQAVDVFSDVQLYRAILHAQEVEREGATAVRLNLTALGDASPYSLASPGTAALNATYANYPAERQAESCDPIRAATAISSDAWLAVAGTLRSLGLAALVLIFVSAVPLLFSIGLALFQLLTVMADHSRTSREHGPGAALQPDRAAKSRMNLSVYVLISQIAMQLLEDGAPTHAHAQTRGGQLTRLSSSQTCRPTPAPAPN